MTDTISLTDYPPRDLAGYGRFPPNPNWPNGAKIAVNFVINYEEGGENSLDNGDAQAESNLQETGPVCAPTYYIYASTDSCALETSLGWRARPSDGEPIRIRLSSRNVASVEPLREA
jgi:hypothetical protein